MFCLCVCSILIGFIVADEGTPGRVGGRAPAVGSRPLVRPAAPRHVPAAISEVPDSQVRAPQRWRAPYPQRPSHCRLYTIFRE